MWQSPPVIVGSFTPSLGLLASFRSLAITHTTQFNLIHRTVAAWQQTTKERKKE
jgi:hypothetical protein